MFERIKQTAAIVALVLVGVLAGELAYTVHVLRPKAREALATAQTTANDVADYTHYQLEDFRSPRNQKMLSHYLQIGEAGLLTIQKFNRTTVPRINTAFDELVVVEHGVQRVVSSTDASVAALTDFIRHSDTSVNVEVVPRLAKLADSLNVTIVDLNADVKRALEAGLTTTEALNKALTNPRFDVLLDETTKAVTNLKDTTGHVEEGMREFPTLMRLYEKYSKTAIKWQRAIYLAQIVNLLAGLPR